MFSTFEIIKELAKKRGISLNQLEEKLGIGKNSLYGLKRNQPSAERWQQMVMLLHHWTSEILLRNLCYLMGNH